MKRSFCLIGFSYFITLFLLPSLPENIWIYIFGVFVFIFFILCLIPRFRREKTFLVGFLVCALATLASVLHLKYNILPIENLDGSDALISAKVIDLPYKKYGKYNYILKINSIDEKKVKPFKLKLSSTEPLEVNVCDNIKLPVHFFLPQSSSFFNSKSYYRSQGIYILAFAYSHSYQEIKTSENFDIYDVILKLRTKMLSLPKYLFIDHAADVMNGFLLGDKQDFPEDVRTNFDIIGVYHLISTSGIHIAILSQFCLWIFKKLKLSSRISALGSAGIIFMFMALTGFRGSILRAGIVAIISQLGVLIFRKSDPLNSLGIAVFSICLFNPYAAVDMGVCMSVSSSLGILLFEPFVNKFLIKKFKIKNSNENKALSYFISIISVSIAASISTFPLSAWYFRKTSLIYLISNLLLIPLATVLLNSVLTLQIFMLLRFPQLFVMPVALVCGITTNLIIDIANLLAKVPFAMISLNYGFVTLCTALSLILFGISLLCGGGKRLIRISLLISLILHLSGYLSYIVFNYNHTKLAVINLNDGMAIVVSKNFRKALILCINEHFTEHSLNEHLMKLHNYKFDYLNVIHCNTQNSKFLNDFIDVYKPQNILIPQNLDYLPNIKDAEKRLIYFNGNASTRLWKDIEVETLEVENREFSLLKIYDLKFLISFSGGDVSKLPEKYKNCDFFIAGKLPAGFKSIKTKNIIVSANKEDSEIILSKLFPSENSLFSTAHNGNVYIDVDYENKYKIRRFE